MKRKFLLVLKKVTTPEQFEELKSLFDIEVNIDYPKLKRHYLVTFDDAKKQDVKNHPYVIHEAAILFESGFYKMMDYTILVSAPEEIRIERVTKRDNISAELVRQRINKQFTDEQKKQLASIELVNDNKNLLIPKILEIDKNLNTHGKIW